MTSQPIRLSCPCCGHGLQIRVESDETVPAARRDTGGGGHAKGSATALERRVGVLESEFQDVLAHLVRQSAQRAPVPVPVLEDRPGTSHWPPVEPARALEHVRAPSRQAVPARVDDSGPIGVDHDEDDDLFAWGESLVVDPFGSAPEPLVEFNPELDESFEADWDSLGDEVDRLRSRLREVERSRDAARAELERDRARWNDERRELQSQLDSGKRESELLRGRVYVQAVPPSLCFTFLSYPEGTLALRREALTTSQVRGAEPPDGAGRPKALGSPPRRSRMAYSDASEPSACSSRTQSGQRT